MKRLALLFALAVLPIVAQTSNPGFAPWDGVHPGFTVETFGIDFGSLQGAVPYEESKRYSLCFLTDWAAAVRWMKEAIVPTFDNGPEKVPAATSWIGRARNWMLGANAAGTVGKPSGFFGLRRDFPVLATDPKINNVRVTINYIDANGNPQKSRQDADFPTNGGSWMYLSFPIRISQVVGSPYFEGRTTAVVATFGPAQ